MQPSKILKPCNFLECFPCGSVTKVTKEGIVSISLLEKLGPTFYSPPCNLIAEMGPSCKKNKSIMRGNFFPHSFEVPQIVSTNNCPREGDDYCKKDLDLKSFLKEKEIILASQPSTKQQ
jgi:hypothetical protein